MKKNKLIFLIIFSLVFLGFISSVNASCCYQNSGKYTYDATMTETICKNNMHGDTTINETACIAQNGKICCNTKTGEIKNGYTDSNCLSNGYQLVDSGTCSKTVTSNITACDVSEQECHDKLNGTYDKSTNCCTYSNTTNVNTQNNAATNPNNPGNQYNNQNNNNNNNNNSTSNPNPMDGSGYSLWDNTKPADSIEGYEIDMSCDNAQMKDVFKLIKTIYNLIRYATPLVLIILGSIDFGKAVMAGKEDDIKKNQHRFVSRLILAVGVFLLLSVFELITNILSKSGVSDGNAWYNCWNSLIIMFK